MADVEWIQARIVETRNAIVQYEQARLARTTGAQSYKLGTGQTDQSVVKATLREINDTLASLRNELKEHEAELYGATHGPASGYVTPVY